MHKSLVMGNCIRLLLAKLRYFIGFTAGVFFLLKLFLPKILNFFQLRFQKNGRKSNFKDTLLVRIKILKFCSGKKFNMLGYLQTVFRLTVIPKQETPKTINCNFCGYSGTKL